MPCSVWSVTPRAAFRCHRPNPRSAICSARRERWKPSSRCWRFATRSRRRRSTSTTRRWKRRWISCRIGHTRATSTSCSRIRSVSAEPMLRWSFAGSGSSCQALASPFRHIWPYLATGSPRIVMTADPRKVSSHGMGTDLTPGVSSYGLEGASEKRLSLRSPRAALEPERVPEPHRPSRRARHPLVVTGSAIFTLILLAAIGVGFALALGKQRIDAAGPLEQSRIVNIPRNVGPRDIADLLQREGVIDQRWAFLGGILVMKDWGKLKSGEYEFKKQASLREVIDTLVEGKVLQHHLTIPEGLTSEQVVQRLMDNDVLSGNIKEIPREGTILPDTYSFPRGSTREQLIQHLQQEQRRVVQDIWNRRSPDLPLKMPGELVVLASLVEKETGKPDERTRIAAVFVNRLKLKMRLQSDPTIIYGLVGGKGTLGR